MAAAQDKINDLKLEVNDLKNKLDNLIELVNKHIEVVERDNLNRDEKHTELKSMVVTLQTDVSTSLTKVNEDIDELTDTMTGIAKSVNDMIAAKNKFNRNLWKIIFAIIMCFITYFVRGTVNKHFENSTKEKMQIEHEMNEAIRRTNENYLTPKDREMVQENDPSEQ
jgi:hypothetical protein